MGLEFRRITLTLLAVFILLAGCDTTEKYERRYEGLPVQWASEYQKCHTDKIFENYEVLDATKDVPEGLQSMKDLIPLLSSVVEKGFSAKGLVLLDIEGMKQIVSIAKRVQARYFLKDRQWSPGSGVFERLLISYDNEYVAAINLDSDSIKMENEALFRIGSNSGPFIDILGKPLLFPGLLAKMNDKDKLLVLDSRKVDPGNRVSAHLISLFLEALFDAALHTPAVSNATTLKVDLSPYSRYPVFDGNDPDMTPHDYEDLKFHVSHQEELVRPAVANSIRGTGTFASGIKDERQAIEIETATNIINKKLEEHRYFCLLLARNKGAVKAKE